MPLRIHSVLAAHDGGPGAVPVVHAARALSRLAEAELHIVHAIEPASAQPAPRRIVAEDEARALREVARRAILADFDSAEPVTSCEVLEGEATEVILDRARMVGADLIVVGPHRGNAPDPTLGTTADRVVRTSPVPCLVVHGAPDLPLRRVLVPTDMSEGARHALEVAMTWTSLLRVPVLSGGGTELVVLHVAPRERDLADLSVELERHVARAVETTGVSAMLEVSSEVRLAEHPADEIVRMGRELDASLVVVGTRDLAGTAAAGLGSVSSTVLRNSKTPILLVPPPPRESG
jgi:universal stress protein E